MTQPYWKMRDQLMPKEDKKDIEPLDQLNMQHLIICFNCAKELKMNFVGVTIDLPDAVGKEVIINSKENFDYKLAYYQNTYKDNLEHNHVRGLKITGFTFGRSFDDIQEDLIGK